ncbi:hypothetical protein [Nocardiopsis valliformis]|uniref:hypothetical protein n=1 Tax=Nocardiopsis valliformis TaxID=239974 RepID=UPI0003463F84
MPLSSGSSLSPLPRPVSGVFVANVMQTACPGYFAQVWLDAEPARSGVDFEFVDALPPTCRHPDEPLPAVFRRYLAQGGPRGYGGTRPGQIALRDPGRTP